jgi:Dolichyl-phosphate-mannose-protein mannosyltransferase
MFTSGKWRSPVGEPWSVLVPLALAQWAAVAVFALIVKHNGWLFFQGGDETFYYTDSWVISHAHIPEAEIGFAWSYLLSPLALIVGPNYLTALPVLIVLQTVILLPLALYCVYAIAARVGGRLPGYAAAALWVAGPFVAIPLFLGRYHGRYVQNFLPQAFGLTGLGDFPSLVCLLLAGLFCLRALDRRDPVDGVVAGLAAGFAVGMKPANALFLAGPALAFLVARRGREALGFAAALVPGLLALALWKYRGLGHLPLFTQSSSALAAGHEPALPVGSSLSRYVNLDWSRLKQNVVQLHEFLPALPVLMALPIAGLIGALRRSLPAALLLLGWVGAFVLVKGTSEQASIESGTLLRLFLPGFPPLLIFTALIPLLWRERQPAGPGSRAVGRRVLAGAAVVFGLVPVLLFLALSPLHDRTTVKYFDENVMVPVDSGFAVSVARAPGGGGELVRWRGASTSTAHAFYRIFRVRPVKPAPDPTLPFGREGIRCLAVAHRRANDCRLEMTPIGESRTTSFVDHPPAGAWIYRVGLVANWLDDSSLGDLILLSAPGRLAAQH